MFVFYFKPVVCADFPVTMFRMRVQIARAIVMMQTITTRKLTMMTLTKTSF